MCLKSDECMVNYACLPEHEPELVLSHSLPMGQCYFVIDKRILGRSWGGFRLAENMTLTEVKVLARTMTIKTILAGIPIGGAKGGVSLSTMRYDKEELLRFVCRWSARTSSSASA